MARNRTRRAARPLLVVDNVVAEPLEDRRLFAAGALDLSFSGDGKVVDGINRPYDFSLASAVQSDGKVVMVGLSESEQDGLGQRIAVARVNANGTPDVGFGGAGTGRLLYDHDSAIARDVAIDGSGRIYVLDGTNMVLRLTTAGALDGSFGGGDGRIDISSSSAFGYASGIAVQPDGKLVVSGTKTNGVVDSAVTVARYTTGGLLDTSFGGGDGIATRDLGSGVQRSADVIVRSDGRIAVACEAGGEESSDIILWTTTSTGAFFNLAAATHAGDQSARNIALGAGNVVFVCGSDYFVGDDVPGWAVAKFDAAGNVAAAFGGGDGFVRVTPVAGNGSAEAVAVAPDGKILVAGFASSFAGDEPIPGFQVARLTSGGSLDATFDGDGRRVVDVGGTDLAAYGVARLSSGDVIVTGTGQSPTGGRDFVAVRLNDNGSNDGAFGVGGRAFVDFDSANDTAADVAVMASGKVVTVGTRVGLSGKGDFAVTRHSASGVLEMVTTFDLDGGDDWATSVEVMDDGRIVVGGYTTPSPGQKTEFAVARFLPNGDVDPHFGDNWWADETGYVNTGFQTVAFTGFNARAWDVKLQPDGKILLAGGAGNATSAIAGDFAVARLDAEGLELDLSFSGDGRQRVNFGSNLSTVARGMKVVSGGKIVLAGWAGGNAAVARMLANGSPDTAFSADGKLTTDWGGSTDQYYGVDVDTSGRIVVAGSSGSNMIVGRYSSAGVLDATFDGDGKRTGPAGQARGVIVQTSGRIIVAGTNVVGGGSAFRVARFLVSGAYDTSFGGGDGQVDTTFAGGSSRAATALAFTTTGKFVVAGFATGVDGDKDFALARYSLT